LWELDKRNANYACDYVINIQLRDMDPHGKYIVMPTDKDTGKPIGLIDEAYRGMDTKQVFDILRKEKEERGKCGGEQPDTESDSSGEGSGIGLDAHDWEGAQDGMTKEEQEQLGRDIDQALRQGGIYAGKVGGNMPREIGELLKPKVNWREVLRRFVRTSLKDRDSVSWRRAHKNYLWQDIILPSIMGKRVKHLVIAMDTSGSIQGPILTEFLSEMNGIVRDTGADRVDVVYWDTEVAGHEIHKGSNKDIVHKTNPVGGGGTDPDCVVDFMTGQDFKPDALIMLTDGYMHTNKPKWAAIKVPTLWCVIGNEKYEVPNGQKLNIN
jgi:predicted metal-dependent peptidase